MGTGTRHFLQHHMLIGYAVIRRAGTVPLHRAPPSGRRHWRNRRTRQTVSHYWGCRQTRGYCHSLIAAPSSTILGRYPGLARGSSAVGRGAGAICPARCIVPGISEILLAGYISDDGSGAFTGVGNLQQLQQFWLAGFGQQVRQRVLVQHVEKRFQRIGKGPL